MSGFTSRRRLAAAIVPPVLLLLTVLGSAYAFVRMRETRAWVAHTRTVIETADRVTADLVQAESAERGFLLTGDEGYLPRYLFGVGALERDTAELRQLTRDNSSQQKRLNALEPLVRERLALLAQGVQLRRMGADTVLSETRLDRGLIVMDSIHQAMVGLQGEESALLDERVAQEERQVLALGLVFLLGILVSGGSAWMVNRALAGYASSQRKALARIEEQNEELQNQAAEMEIQHDSLEEQAAELEILNEQLTDRSIAAERAQEAAERAREIADALRKRTDAILASISDVFFILDGEARVQYANRPARELFGSLDIVGRELWRVAPELASRLEAPLRRALEGRQVVRFEEYFPLTSVYYAAALYPADTGISVFLHDVTASHARQAEFKVMTEAMPQLVWSADAAGTVDYWNDRWCAYTGMPENADLNEVWLSYLHPEDAPVAGRAWEYSVATGEPYEVEYRLRRASDGAYRWFISRGLPVQAPDGKILRWFGTSTDIDDERAATQAVQVLSRELKARVDELETMFEILPIGVAVSQDAHCREMRVNASFSRLLRVSEHDNISKSGPDAERLPFRAMRGDVEIAPDALPMQMAARLGRSIEGSEYDLLFADGVRLHMYGSAAPLLDEHGAVRGAIGAFVDVSRRVQAEAEARRLADRTAKLYALSAALTRAATPEQVAAVAGEWGRAVLGAAATIFLVLKPDGALEALSSSGMPTEFVGRWHNLPLVRRTPVTEAIRTGAVVAVSSAAERDRLFPGVGWPSGLEAMFAGALRFESRALGAWAVHFDGPRAFGEDDLKLFEAVSGLCAQALERARLFQAERAARESAEQANQAKLKFLRVMSHDLRTPLNAILGYTELLQDGVGGSISEAQRTYLGRIRASTTILRLLIEDILEFARIEAGHVEIRAETVPVSRLLDGVEALMGEQVRAKGITLARGSCDAELLVRADPERARQVLMNLVSNSLKFTAAGGRIVLECDTGPERVRIAVRDTGIGIPADEIERIFEPFVQAHRPQELGTEQGVGLGLTISRELARAMGGDVTARGEPGVGSVFTLELPRVQVPTPETHVAAHA